MAEGLPGWELEGFLERLDLWITVEAPSDHLRRRVTAWILTRFEDPYSGVRREAGFANLWFGPVARVDDASGRVVVCSYWIEESRRLVRCDSFATLFPPL